jgi:hypothetical protein
LWFRDALLWGNRGRRRRGIATVTTPTNWGGRCGDATRSSEDHEQRDEGLVKHHCEDSVEAMEILKAEAALGLGDRRVMSCLLINLLPWLTGPIAAMVHSLPATEPAWNPVLTGVLSVRLF